MDIFGQTRSRVERNYALITPDTHVPSPLINWKNSTAVVHISPQMGARFTQYTATMEEKSEAGAPGETAERFIYVQEGSCTLAVDENRKNADLRDLTTPRHELKVGAYAFIPCGMGHLISSKAGCTLIVFEKTYQPNANFPPASAVIGHADDVNGEPFMGDEDARLKTLLPINESFDMAVNLFTYQPGATLPQVEIHVMEHGLMMLEGQGVYRLGDDYMPVMAGDVIWMASYCPQWFVAMGKTPATYIYYKDIHRDRLCETELKDQMVQRLANLR